MSAPVVASRAQRLEDRLLAELTDPQREAVTHEQGPLLIIAGAGTGKTTVITRRIAWLIASGRSRPDEILALTFTDKAAAQMEERVDLLVPYGYTEIAISTFHAFGDRLLREHALEAGLSPETRVLSRAEQIVFLREHLFELPLGRLRPLPEPDRYVEALATVIARAKDEAVTSDEFLALAKQREAEALAAPDDEGGKADAELTRELAGCYEAYLRLLREQKALDFGGQILLTIWLFEQHPEWLSRLRAQYRYILVDEFQDTNFAQFRLLQLLAQPLSHITVVADDDQCLPRGTMISTVTGFKPIEDVKVGDEVLTAVGKGHLGTSRVTRTFRSTKAVRLLTVTTKRGHVLQVTDNHKMFCYVPTVAPRKDLHYVYLMHRRDVGWRLGMTNDLATRLRLERSADRIVGVQAFQSDTEARYHETLWSLRYGIPTTIFKTRTNVMQGELMVRLQQALETDHRVRRLAKDLHVDLRAAHVCLDGVHRGNQRRVKVNLSLCSRRYRTKYARGAILKNPRILHTVRMQTSDPHAVAALQQAGVPIHKAKKGVSVQFAYADLAEAGRMAERLAQLTGGILEASSALGRFRYEHPPAVVMPAKNILPGHYVPVYDTSHTQVLYDEVVKVTDEAVTMEVLDLEVARTHNFIANGVVVHNSIYKWRGAAISNVLKFLEHYHQPRRVVLTENFRSSQPILDCAYRLIRFNDPDRLEIKEGINKRLVAMCRRQPIEPRLMTFDTASSEADWVARRIKEQLDAGRRRAGEFAILVRTNKEADLFLRALNVCGIPWQFSGRSGLFAREEVKMLVSGLKTLADPDDTLSWYHVASSTLYRCPMEDLVACLARANRTNQSLRVVFEQMLRARPGKRSGRAGDAPESPALSEEGKQAIGAYLADVKRLLECSRTLSPGQLLYRWLTDTGWLKRHAAPERAEDADRLQAVARFFDQLHRFEGVLGNRLPELMRSMDWFQALDESNGEDVDPLSDDRVHVLTLHKAKGLEFPVVFLVGLVQGRFPTQFRRDPLELPEPLIKDILPTGNYHLQEERRLFYVGMTRAKEELYLTAAHDYGGKTVRKMSQFVLEALNMAAPAPPSVVPSAVERIARAKPPGAARSAGAVAALPEPLRLDAHGVDDYLTCPLKFRYSHVLRIPIMRHPLVIYGSALHKAVEMFFKRRLQGQAMSEAELLQTFAGAWSSEGFLTREHEELRLARGRDVLQKFFAEQHRHPEQPTLIEEKFTFPLDDVRVVGRWDRVDCRGDEVVIIDYKSSEVTTQRQADQRARDSLQMAIYALAWQQIHGTPPKRVELRFLETGLIGTATFTDEDLEETRERLREVAKGIRALDFHPEPKAFTCRWCAYQSICQFSAV